MSFTLREASSSRTLSSEAGGSFNVKVSRFAARLFLKSTFVSRKSKIDI